MWAENNVMRSKVNFAAQKGLINAGVVNRAYLEGPPLAAAAAADHPPGDKEEKGHERSGHGPHPSVCLRLTLTLPRSAPP